MTPLQLDPRRSVRLHAYTALLTCLLVMALAAPALASNISGAVYTTFPDGITVNGNIYPTKDIVYLNGGPQNMHGQGLPDGNYYYQVTDPSGAVLLSQDDVTCRVVNVTNGVVNGHPTDDAGGFGTPACYHINGTTNPSNGSTGVQLCSASGCPSGPPPMNGGNLSYYDTPNHGGEYKVWLTPVDQYVGALGTCNTGRNVYGFCDSQTKTDNFKVRTPGVAYITACKFIDVDGNGTFDGQDFFTAGWPVTATGVDGGTVTQNTDQDGCTTFTLSGLPNHQTAPVTVYEQLQGGFTQTAPQDATPCTFVSVDDHDGGAACVSVASGLITITVDNDDALTVPYFGNHPGGATPPPLRVSKTAAGGNNFHWTINKTAQPTEIDNANGTATFTYHVTATHDGGTGWIVAGAISITNPGSADANNVSVTDSIDNGGTCSVDGGNGTDTATVTVPAMMTINVNYSCTFATNPTSGTNTVTVDWPDGSDHETAMQAYDFTAAATSVTVTDSLAGSLGTASINPDLTTACTAASVGFTGDSGSLSCSPNGSSATFTYTLTFTDPAGTCTTHDNTATFTTNTNVTGMSGAEVKHCVGKDLTVAKTATASFNSSIAKSVDKTIVEQGGGTITFHYTVTVTESGWQVTGNITVTNPNDWEDIVANVTDAIDGGGVCVVTGGAGVTIPKSNQVVLPYTCTYSSRPTLVTGTNTATAAVVSGVVPDPSVNGTAPYTFATLTITDNVQSSAYPGGCNATLGTVSVTTTTPNGTPGCGITGLASPQWGVFTYAITDANSNPGTCTSYTNIASIVGGGSANQTVTVCNTNTGALTMGFWKGPNGQRIITMGCNGTMGTSLKTYLNQFNPFKDDTGATCNNQASYVNNVIGAANCSSGGTCNLMLRAQMLATALDVYFSDPTLGGNKIGAYNGLGGMTPPLGGVNIDLSKVCAMVDGSSGSTCSGLTENARPEFGINPAGPPNPCLGTSVSMMLFYSDFSSVPNGMPVASAPNGSTWYKQIKNPNQVYAKDSFDSFNNQVAKIAPSGTTCSPSF